MKVKKGKATLLAAASVALIASLVYDKKCKKSLENEKEKEASEESDNNFIIQ